MTKKEAGRQRILGKVLFVLYIAFLLYFLFLSDWYGREGVLEEYRYNLIPFKEIRRFITYWDQLGAAAAANLFGNVLIFVPFGFFVSMAGKENGLFKTLFFSMGLSLFVEVLQLISRVGSFDVDDILLNAAGGVLGYLVFRLWERRRRKKKR